MLYAGKRMRINSENGGRSPTPNLQEGLGHAKAVEAEKRGAEDHRRTDLSMSNREHTVSPLPA